MEAIALIYRNPDEAEGLLIRKVGGIPRDTMYLQCVFNPMFTIIPSRYQGQRHNSASVPLPFSWYILYFRLSHRGSDARDR